MWRWVFLVVRPQLSSPNPNFSKPRTRTENSDFWSWLTHQLLGRLKFTNPNLQIYLPKMLNSEKLGLGIDNPCRIVFLSLRMNNCLERVNDRHVWNPGVFSNAMIPRRRPNLKLFFFHRHIYSLWSDHRSERRPQACSCLLGTELPPASSRIFSLCSGCYSFVFRCQNMDCWWRVEWWSYLRGTHERRGGSSKNSTWTSVMFPRIP